MNQSQEFIAKTYLPLVTSESPLDAVQTVVDWLQAYGWRVFQAILTATCIETRGRLRCSAGQWTTSRAARGVQGVSRIGARLRGVATVQLSSPEENS